MQLTFRSGTEEEWEFGGNLTVNLDEGYDFRLCVKKAHEMLAEWTPEERWYHFFRGTDKTKARVVSFLHRWGDVHISIVSLAVLPYNGDREMFIVIDDYKRHYENWVVYGTHMDKMIRELGLEVGGCYLWLPSIPGSQESSERR